MGEARMSAWRQKAEKVFLGNSESTILAQEIPDPNRMLSPAARLDAFPSIIRLFRHYYSSLLRVSLLDWTVSSLLERLCFAHHCIFHT